MMKAEELNKGFVNEIIEAGTPVPGEKEVASLKSCYQCGTCTGSCPSGRRTAYRRRKVIRQALLGIDSVLDSDDIWKCTTCYTCYERCPRDVKVTEIIKTIRNLAAQKGNMAKPHKMTAVYVLKAGHAVPANDDTAKLRKSIGLAEKAPIAQFSQKDMDEIRTIAKNLKFDELIGFDWKTMGLKQ